MEIVIREPERKVLFVRRTDLGVPHLPASMVRGPPGVRGFNIGTPGIGAAERPPVC